MNAAPAKRTSGLNTVILNLGTPIDPTRLLSMIPTVSRLKAFLVTNCWKRGFSGIGMARFSISEANLSVRGFLILIAPRL